MRIAVSELVTLMLLAGASVQAGTVINFDDAPLGSLTTFYSGVDFGGTALVELAFAKGGALNPSLPPNSPDQAALDNAGFIRAKAVGGSWSEVTARVTGFAEVIETAYDSLNNIVGTPASTGGRNTGNPNMLLDVTAPLGQSIAYVKFTTQSDAAFAVDDFTVSAAGTVPDMASTLQMLGVATVGLLMIQRRSQLQRRHV